MKTDTEPYHGRPFPVPKIHELTLKKELGRLEKLGILKKVNRSQWGAPTFIIPKKDGTVRFISDFRELNKHIKREPYPIPKIKDLLLQLEGITYGTSLDRNMGYYHISLRDKSKEMCTITTQWGKSFFGVNKLEYLGYAISTEGIFPIPKKLEALKAIQIPKTRRQLRRFIGMINYYRDMW
jgi:hypothetical protein